MLQDIDYTAWKRQSGDGNHGRPSIMGRWEGYTYYYVLQTISDTHYYYISLYTHYYYINSNVYGIVFVNHSSIVYPFPPSHDAGASDGNRRIKTIHIDFSVSVITITHWNFNYCLFLIISIEQRIFLAVFCNAY